jgi:hypothetical protein
VATTAAETSAIGDTIIGASAQSNNQKKDSGNSY